MAELAASGMTKREVAAALFISPKAVEANPMLLDTECDPTSERTGGGDLRSLDDPLRSRQTVPKRRST